MKVRVETLDGKEKEEEQEEKEEEREGKQKRVEAICNIIHILIYNY